MPPRSALRALRHTAPPSLRCGGRRPTTTDQGTGVDVWGVAPARAVAQRTRIGILTNSTTGPRDLAGKRTSVPSARTALELPTPGPFVISGTTARQRGLHRCNSARDTPCSPDSGEVTGQASAAATRAL